MAISGDVVTATTSLAVGYPNQLAGLSATGAVKLPTASTSTAGNATLNAACGQAGVASGTSAMTLTNSFITTSSTIILTLVTTGASVGGVAVFSQTGGSAVIKSVNGTGVVTTTGADTFFNFLVIN